MAEFCKQCSIDLFGRDFGEFAGRTSEKEWKAGLAVVVLCEGCGPIQVDPDGKCVSDDCYRQGEKGHGCEEGR